MKKNGQATFSEGRRLKKGGLKMGPGTIYMSTKAFQR